MNRSRIFISSVQREFAQERKALRDFLQNDPLMRRFFDVFLFEDVPASDRVPLLAEPLYLTQYIERMGTGTLDMIRRCRDAGLPEPEFDDSSGFKTTIWRAKPSGLPESLPESLPEL